MQLIEVNSAKLIRSFHQIPFELYKNDPHWIPHIKQDIEKVFDRNKNKLFKEGGNAIRWILQNDEGKNIGRIAAFINPRVVETTKFKTGGVGFFECINDKSAANYLFESSKKWLQEQGMEAMDGPINFGDRNQYWGCQITNFEEPPIYPMNYNLPYYRELFEAYGFQTYFEQYMYWRDIHVPAQEIFKRKFNQLKANEDFIITNIKGFKAEKVAYDFAKVYNGAWGGHSHFKPMTNEAALKIMKAMWPAVDPEIVIFVYYKNEPLAFYINLPELNQIFKYVNGNMNWLGKLKFIYHKYKKTPTRMTGIIFGVVREWHGKGLDAAMIVYGEKTIANSDHYRDTVLSWIGDFNPKMIKVAENLGTKLWRTFITYRYQFDRSAPFERAPIVEEQRQ